ncbi:MAG: CBS domain-containing protein [Desulfobacterales bacterium]
MHEKLVKDLMVPLSEYAAISENASLHDAVQALEKAQTAWETSKSPYQHRAVLVYDKNHEIVGKLGQIEILKGLEPKYNQGAMLNDRITECGFSKEFMRALITKYSLLDKPLLDICRKASKIKAKDCMYIPEEGEFIDTEETLNLAINQLVLGRYQSLLVTRNKKIAGILRLTDVFKEVSDSIKVCAIED